MKREATLYEILEVSPNASDLVIKAAYRSLAQHNHPDKNAGAEASGERLAQINHAYSVLSDALTRARYDRTIDLAKKSFERRGGGMTTYDRSASNGAGHKGSRPFVFRHLF